jgi:hypothetical protein
VEIDSAHPGVQGVPITEVTRPGFLDIVNRFLMVGRGILVRVYALHLDVRLIPIFNSRPWIAAKDDVSDVDVRYTHRGGDLFLIAFDWPAIPSNSQAHTRT